MPEGGAQTDLLCRQLAAMEDGGLVVIAVPANPLSLPTRPLRARQPDRPLFEGKKIALKGDRPRR
jgi:hypothetical protein